MKEVKNEGLVESVKKIIQNGDLDTLTFTKIFQTLQEKFETQLEDKKKFLRQTVSEILEEYRKQEEEDVNVDIIETKEETDKKEEKEEEDVDVEGETEEQPKEDDFIEVSEKERALQELIMDSIKYGSNRQTRGATTRRKSNNTTTGTSSTKSKKRSKAEDDDGVTKEGVNPSPKKKKKMTGFAKPMVLSPALADFMGASELPRTEVVKRLHAHIKDNNLQNPKDKRKIMLDVKLQEIFKCKTTDYFKINRLISKHVKSADEVV